MLLPPPGRVPLMIGSNGDRMLSIALPHVDCWNTWYAGYGNTAEGFAELNGRITTASERAGRDPADMERSAACWWSSMRRRCSGRARTRDSCPSRRRTSGHLRALAEAGADEAILILRPITEASIRALGRLLPISRRLSRSPRRGGAGASRRLRRSRAPRPPLRSPGRPLPCLRARGRRHRRTVSRDEDKTTMSPTPRPAHARTDRPCGLRHVDALPRIDPAAASAPCIDLSR